MRRCKVQLLLHRSPVARGIDVGIEQLMIELVVAEELLHELRILFPVSRGKPDIPLLSNSRKHLYFRNFHHTHRQLSPLA